jgi:hypothetical protein
MLCPSHHHGVSWPFWTDGVEDRRITAVMAMMGGWRYLLQAGVGTFKDTHNSKGIGGLVIIIIVSHALYFCADTACYNACFAMDIRQRRHNGGHLLRYWWIA